jgi:hypothetical protein
LLASLLAAGGGCSKLATTDLADPGTGGGAIPAEANPCRDAAYWPFTTRSTRRPVQVHYSHADDAAMADTVLDHIDRSWAVQVDGLGFRPPLDDGGACRQDDGRYDVFLWRGAAGGYVDSLGGCPTTPYADVKSYLVIDPWGPYGGDALPATIAHELNHALQASDDWEESPPAFEMTATFMEEVVVPDNNSYLFTVDDFQARPHWSLYRNDNWATWYMYGASIYLQLLRARYFDGDASFTAAMWRLARSAPGTDEPDFVDALDELLGGRGVTFADSVAKLAVWRWYTGSRTDGQHFADARHMAEVRLAATVSSAAPTSAVPIAIMAFASAYLELVAESDAVQMLVAVEPTSSDVRWIAQLVPGLAGTDREPVDLDAGPFLVSFPDRRPRTLIMTAVPVGAYDPDDANATLHRALLRVATQAQPH